MRDGREASDDSSSCLTAVDWNASRLRVSFPSVRGTRSQQDVHRREPRHLLLPAECGFTPTWARGLLRLYSSLAHFLNASGLRGTVFFIFLKQFPWRFTYHQQRRDLRRMICIEEQGHCVSQHGEMVFLVPEGGNCHRRSDTNRWVDEAMKAS